MRIPLQELLYALSRALDFVEQELLGVTSNHGKRAAYVAVRICRAMGLPESDIFDMAGCAILHDNALTAYMLHAGPGRIGRLEHFESHCARGEENAAAFPFTGDTSGIVLHHHENWNGTGFHKLAGADIPLRAVILRLADNTDLRLRMGDGRAGLEREIREHVRENSGKLYAPITVEALLDSLDADFARDLTDAHIDESLARVVPQLQVELTTEQMLNVCTIFAFIIDAKSSFTKNHSTGIADKASRLARYYGMDQARSDELRIAGYLHDVGKLSTPLSILEKPDRLTPEEFAIMRNHVVMSEEILKDVKGLDQIVQWACNHHEKLNGKGYAHGYGAADLSFESRLLACCDIYQALTEDRPYRPGMPHDKATAILEDMARNGEIDPTIVADIRKEFA